MTRRFLSILLPAAGVLAVATATALPASPTTEDFVANQCGPRNDMVAALDQNFQENQTAQGVVNPEVVIEVFASEAGTWTILATGTDGNSCVISAGEGWDNNMMASLPGA